MKETLTSAFLQARETGSALSTVYKQHVINCSEVSVFQYMLSILCACFVLCLQIVRRYDILLIQEIRDRYETAIGILVDAVNTEIGYVSDFSLPHTYYTLELSLFLVQ